MFKMKIQVRAHLCLRVSAEATGPTLVRHALVHGVDHPIVEAVELCGCGEV